MKKIFTETLIILSIIILFLSLLFSTSYFLWKKRKVIANYFSVELKDDCSLSIGRIKCSYLKVKKDKKFDISLKNVDLKFKLLNFVKNKPFLNVQIDRGNIFIRIEKEGKRIKKIKSNPFYYPFFAIYFVKSDINDFYVDLELPDRKEIVISKFSFSNISNNFFSKRPFFIKYDNFQAEIFELKGHIQPDRIVIDKSSAYINKNTLNIYGEFDYRGNYAFNGKFSGKYLHAYKISLKSFMIDFNIKAENSLKTGNFRFNINSAFYNNIKLSRINLKIGYRGENKINGDISGKIRKIQSDKAIFNGVFINQKFRYITADKKFYTYGNLDLKEILFKKLKLQNISSDIKTVYFRKKFSVSGEAKTGNIKLSFNYHDKILKLLLKKVRLSDIYSQLSLENKLVDNISGEIEANAQINFKNNHTTLSGNLYNPYIFGLSYEKGSVYADVDNKKITGSYTVKLYRSQGFAFLNGSFKKSFINGDLSFENLNLTDLIYGKKYKFGGILDGNGHYEGNLTGINLSITGIAQQFFYKNIRLKDVEYSFSYNPYIKNIFVDFKRKDLKGSFSLFFKPLSLNLEIFAKNSDMEFLNPYLESILPDIFSKVSLLKASGHFVFTLKEKIWKVLLDFPEGKAFIKPIGDNIGFSAKGKIINGKQEFNLSFFKEDLKIKDYTVKTVKGIIKIKDGKGFTKISATDMDIFDRMKFSISVNFDISNRYINGTVKLFTQKGNFKNNISTNFAGILKLIKGKLVEKGFLNKKAAIKTSLDYSLNILKDKTVFKIFSKGFKLFLPEKFIISFVNISGNLEIPHKNPEDFSGYLQIDKFTVAKNYLYFFDSTPLKIVMDRGTIRSGNIFFTGIINGSIREFTYKNKKIYLYSEGKIDKNLLSVLLKYANTSGDLFYTLEYKGGIKNILENLHFKIYSKNLGVKTAYTVGITKIKKLLFEYKKGKFKVGLNGNCSEKVLGECLIKLTGKGNASKKYYQLSLKSKFFPVRYTNIASGNINSNIKIKSLIRNGLLYHLVKGKIGVIGKIKLEKDMQSMFQKKSSSGEKSEKLEKILLDLNVESYVPIYIYGSWGKAYGEMDIKITGTAASPVVNGNISIIYGDIYFMKNKYNIDFANIKIINNEPYISARISTSISDTFIFIDVSGSLLSPNINFSSSPPMSKDEILSILLLRDTPSALENMPIFQTVGKIIYALLPFKPQEERGLFNTGFEINILPQYSPSTGISASIYAKRNLTRRIFIALSKPLGQIEEGKVAGWYSFGIRIRERTSFQYKWFEDNNQEFGIVFNWPFDF